MKTAEISAKLYDHMGGDLTVVNAARVSFNKESEYIPDEFSFSGWGLSDKDERLIQYLVKNKHFSPFNHCFITFRVKAPIFVARQLVKHKFMPWNEVSRRYVDDEPEFYFPKEWRGRPISSKQGSEGVLEMEEEPDGFCHSMWAEEVCQSALNWYNTQLKRGMAPEMARMMLPQNMMTEWFWSGTLGAYADMLKLRLDPHTQYESQIVAKQIRDELLPLYPYSLAALLEYK